MQLIKLPKKQYETLRRKASVYDRVLRFSPELLFEIENYSDDRVRQFLTEDKVDSVVLASVKKLLKNAR